MADVSTHFGLHELAVEDASTEHQRPKVEGYDGFHLIVYKTAQYDDRKGTIEFGELDIFLGVGFVIAVRHGAAGDPRRTQFRLEERPELLKVGPAAVVWGILDMVVDDYVPAVEGLENSIEEIERAIFAGQEDLTKRIYLLKTELNELYRALHPLLAPLEAMERGVLVVIPACFATSATSLTTCAAYRTRGRAREQLVAARRQPLAPSASGRTRSAPSRTGWSSNPRSSPRCSCPWMFIRASSARTGWMVRHIDSAAMSGPASAHWRRLYVLYARSERVRHRRQS
jgi:hypothetical protein